MSSSNKQQFFVDLTHPVKEGMPAFPGTKPPAIHEACTFEEHGFRERRLSLYSHTGTHIDAPSHMINDGGTLDDYPVDYFLGRARILQVDQGKKVIGVDTISQLAPDLEAADYLLIATGWDRFWGTENYFTDFPVLSEDAAILLQHYSLKGVGVDVISADRMDSVDFPVHLALLGKGMVIIENLTRLTELSGEWCDFICMPLNIEGGDGAPVRALAIDDRGLGR